MPSITPEEHAEKVLAGPPVRVKVTSAKTSAGTERHEVLDALLGRLLWAVYGQRSEATCLRHWSRFVRTRDGHRCVECDSEDRVSAHHICRKSFLAEARFEPGNGITLCRACHAEVHEGFNGAPDLQEPMDSQGGEKIEAMTRLFGALAQDALKSPEDRPLDYYLSEGVLRKFRRFQGVSLESPMHPTPVYEAYLTWNRAPVQVMEAILRANLPADMLRPGD